MPKVQSSPSKFGKHAHVGFGLVSRSVPLWDRTHTPRLLRAAGGPEPRSVAIAGDSSGRRAAGSGRSKPARSKVKGLEWSWA